LLAMVVGTPRGVRLPALSLTTIATVRRLDMLAPTGTAPAKPNQTTRSSVSSPRRLLIHPPLRQAEWRHSSGEWARSAVRRSRTHREEVQRSKPEAMSPEGCRSEGTTSLSERPYAWGQRFFAYFFLALVKKVSRRKGETIGGRYRRNGYARRKAAIASKLAPTERQQKKPKKHRLHFPLPVVLP